MIFFDNSGYYLTPNYYAQKLFSANSGDYYVEKIITKNSGDSAVSASCVVDSKSGDIILKFANAGKDATVFSVNLVAFGKILPVAVITVLSGTPNAENSFQSVDKVAPVTTPFNANKKFNYTSPPFSVTVIRIKTK